MPGPEKPEEISFEEGNGKGLMMPGQEPQMDVGSGFIMRSYHIAHEAMLGLDGTSKVSGTSSGNMRFTTEEMHERQRLLDPGMSRLSFLDTLPEEWSCMVFPQLLSIDDPRRSAPGFGHANENFQAQPDTWNGAPNS